MSDARHGKAQPEQGNAGGPKGNSGTRPTLVAVDLGAESCRVSLLQWIDGQPRIQMVHRFANAPIQGSSGLRWNLRMICGGVEEGLRKTAELAPEGIAAIGVDGWAVDYVRLNAEGRPISDPFCYRDARNTEALKQVHARIAPDRLYALTGIQILQLNTLYQLYADGVPGFDQSCPWVTLPEFILHWLGGRRVAEYTNATTTQMLDVQQKSWCREIFQAAGLDMAAAPPVAMPGTDVGQVKAPLASLPAFQATRLITPACHDTASAIAGIPAHGDDWAFISSGTWSLVGSVLDAACVCEAAQRKNFSNSGGIGGKVYFLKNVNGMWLLRQCMEQWESEGRAWRVDELVEACSRLPAPDSLFDVDDADLLLPGNMPAKINAQLRRNGSPTIPEEPAMAPRVAQLIFHSLAARYDAVLKDLSSITGKKLKQLYIVGGGSRNTLLNRLAAAATGLEVLVGSTESTTIGNFAVQLAALSGSYIQSKGVTASAVAEWAGTLVGQPIEPRSKTGAIHSN